MERLARAVLVVASLAVAGCGGDSGNETDEPSVPSCSSGELALEDGGCFGGAIPPEQCGEGFEGDERGGCVAIAPAGVCPPGTMAVPGEQVCRDVAPCGEPPWGDIPVDGATIYVDASYPGADSDGSAARPWTTIEAAVSLASPGALIAVAEGSYTTSVDLQKPVRLWGRCPALVDVVVEQIAAFAIRPGSDGTELHTLGIRGPGNAVQASGVADVLLDRLWLHDLQGVGLATTDDLGVAGVSVVGSLIEGASNAGVYIKGSATAVEATAIRGTTPVAGQSYAVLALDGPAGRSHVTISSSLMEAIPFVGVAIRGGQAVIEASLLRDVTDLEGADGVGIVVQDPPTATVPSALEIGSSVLERLARGGVLAIGTNLSLQATVLRDVFTTQQALSGRGLMIQRDGATGRSAVATLQKVVVERTAQLGIFVAGSSLEANGLTVAEVAPGLDLDDGIGLAVRIDEGTPASIALDEVLIRDNHDVGIFLIDSDATVARSQVRRTAPTVGDGTFGDGIVALNGGRGASLSITDSLVSDSARAALASFGAAVTLEGTSIQCNPIDLNGESAQGSDFLIEDLGGNDCGCESEEESCRVVSTALTPPDPVE